MSDDKIREAFEHECRKIRIPLGTDRKGKYKNKIADAGWAFFKWGSEWQAAQRQCGEAVKKEIDAALDAMDRRDVYGRND